MFKQSTVVLGKAGKPEEREAGPLLADISSDSELNQVNRELLAGASSGLRPFGLSVTASRRGSQWLGKRKLSRQAMRLCRVGVIDY